MVECTSLFRGTFSISHYLSKIVYFVYRFQNIHICTIYRVVETDHITAYRVLYKFRAFTTRQNKEVRSRLPNGPTIQLVCLCFAGMNISPHFANFDFVYYDFAGEARTEIR